MGLKLTTSRTASERCIDWANFTAYYANSMFLTPPSLPPLKYKLSPSELQVLYCLNNHKLHPIKPPPSPPPEFLKEVQY